VITMAMIGKVWRMWFRQKKSVRETSRATSLSRNTVRKYLRVGRFHACRFSLQPNVRARGLKGCAGVLSLAARGADLRAKSHNYLPPDCRRPISAASPSRRTRTRLAERRLAAMG